MLGDVILQRGTTMLGNAVITSWYTIEVHDTTKSINWSPYSGFVMPSVINKPSRLHPLLESFDSKRYATQLKELTALQEQLANQIGYSVRRYSYITCGYLEATTQVTTYW